VFVATNLDKKHHPTSSPITCHQPNPAAQQPPIGILLPSLFLIPILTCSALPNSCQGRSSRSTLAPSKVGVVSTSHVPAIPVLRYCTYSRAPVVSYPPKLPYGIQIPRLASDGCLSCLIDVMAPKVDAIRAPAEAPPTPTTLQCHDDLALKTKVRRICRQG
jgi:hypothetical protein